MLPLLGKTKDLSKVVDTKSSLKGRKSTASGSIEICVDGAEVNTLCYHGKGLTNDLDNVVNADDSSDLALNTLDKADKLSSQGDGENSLNLEINSLASCTVEGGRLDPWFTF